MLTFNLLAWPYLWNVTKPVRVVAAAAAVSACARDVSTFWTEWSRRIHPRAEIVTVLLYNHHFSVGSQELFNGKSRFSMKTHRPGHLRQIGRGIRTRTDSGLKHGRKHLIITCGGDLYEWSRITPMGAFSGSSKRKGVPPWPPNG